MIKRRNSQIIYIFELLLFILQFEIIIQCFILK